MKADRGEIVSMLQNNNSTFEQLLSLKHLEPFREQMKGGPYFRQCHEAHKCPQKLFLLCKRGFMFLV